MTIRKKILFYVSTTIVLLVGITFLFIYTLFSEYREEEFQQRQKEKIVTTLKFLTDVEDMNESIAQAMDKITIHDFYDEKMLIYDQQKNLTYASIDDLPISISTNILNQLSEEINWIETKEGAYDVIGIYVKNQGKHYYGISKAYDEFGFTKLNYLKTVLFIAFILIAIIVLLVSNYISITISKPLEVITKKIREFDYEKDIAPIELENNDKSEINLLALRFNELMKRMNDAFSFQKYAINHISHELKTPIAILVSNFEKIEREKNPETVQKLIELQKKGTKSLANIINTLLEIAKIENSESLGKKPIRIDELIFDIIQELQVLHPNFSFKINYPEDTSSLEHLSIHANEQLIKSALTNLMLNSIQYNEGSFSEIKIEPTAQNLKITLVNKGQVISDNEIPLLFEHFFRGQNSEGKSGFGLGLVLVQKIIELHQGTVRYKKENEHLNIFELILPTKNITD